MEMTDVFVLTTPALIDPSLAIAAHRAGALGVLDLEYAQNSQEVIRAVDRVARFANGRFGVLVRAGSSLLESILASTTKPSHVIFTGGDHSELPRLVERLSQNGYQIFLEVVSLEEAVSGAKAGVSGVVLKGLEAGGRSGPDTSSVLVQKWRQHAQKHNIKVPFWVRGGIGPQATAEMLSAGAQGVVLDSQLLLAHESPLDEAARKHVVGLGEKDAITLGERIGETYRFLARVDDASVRDLRLDEEQLLALDRPADEKLRLWREAIRSRLATGSSQGLWVIGQDVAAAAGLAKDHVTVAGIINAVCKGAQPVATETAPPPCDVAIIGLSCFYPKATGASTYWSNILNKVNGVIEVPPTHWDWRPYYDPDPRARDKMISKWGGFMDDVYFDPLTFGITPKSLKSIEPLQLLLLEAVRQGIADAGYATRPFARERTAAILGVGGGGMPMSVAYGFRACLPLIDSIPGVPVKSSEIVSVGDGMLPEWTEDSFPGILLNVAAGRIANRFNLGGPNMAIDAACGSSLAALYAGVRELNDGTSDVAIVMGADAVQTPFAYVAFSKTHALSPKGRCRPFDAAADGIVLAEGIGVAVLKRLADAERDGDRIYAVIKGVGASSDGRDKGLTAPRAEGQLLALNRAYAQARVSPAHVGLVEAHGTGTVVGDQTEARALGQVFREAGGQPASCALGSVKSMIGHSKCAAGLAGLIKTAFALHHKLLPPTLVETPNPKGNFDGGPLYLNTDARPWVHGADHPRTAGVSAFGFGGTNFHTVLEEYTGDYLNRPASGLRSWPAELFVWRRANREEILTSLKHCQEALNGGAKPDLAALAASVWQSNRAGTGMPTLAIVALSLGELTEKIELARTALGKPDAHVSDPRGIYFSAKPEDATGKIAFLFPGQGSQYPDMLAQQAMAFAEVREALDRAERTLANDLEKPLGKFIYPPSAFTTDEEQKNRRELQRTEIAQLALGACGLGLARLLNNLGIEADYLAGHSYGEYPALAAAGALSEEDLVRLSHKRGQVIRDAAASAAGGMAAVDAPGKTVERLLAGIDGVWVANHNSPQQTVIAGTEAALAAAMDKIQAGGTRIQRIPVACAFHTPLIFAAAEPLKRAIASVKFAAPKKQVFSNTTASAHPTEPEEIARRLVEHVTRPVRFADEVLAMHEAGARVFIEVGPQGVLTALTGQTLSGRPHLAVASDLKTRPGLLQLCHLLGQLLVGGVAVRLDRIFEGRGLQTFELSKLSPETGKVIPSATSWVVNGVRSRPLNGPEPRLLGQALPPSAPAESKKTLPTVAATLPTAAQPAATPLASAQQKALQAPSTNGTPKPTKPPVTAPSTSSPVSPLSANLHNRMNNAEQLITPDSNPAPTEGAAQVMMRFQDVMSRFLDTQKSVMLNFLGSQPATPAPSRNAHAHSNGNGHANGHAPLPALPKTPSPLPVNRLPASEPLAKPVATPASTKPAGNGQAIVKSSPTPSENGKAHSSEVAITTASKPAADMSRDGLLAQLIDLVSDRTGYPKEAISIDLDLEADLGIDSIKRVEILGTLAETLETAGDGKQPNLEMEKLSVIKTLRGIADYVSSAFTAPAQSVAKVEVAKSLPPASHPGARQGDIQRLVVRLIDAPLPIRQNFTPPNGTVLITDDGQGYARELADRLGERDVNAVLVQHKPGELGSEASFAGDLSDPAQVETLLDRLRTGCGPIAGLIHLLPLAEDKDGIPPLQRTTRNLKSLYLLARGLEADLRQAGENGGAVFLAVTTLGGTMGYGDHLPERSFAGDGGIAGFVKCVGYEWPEVTVRVVDVDPETPPTQLGELLITEMGDQDGPFEVGRTPDRRVTWQCEPGPLAVQSSALQLAPTDTVLITGGARGITARVARELADRFQCKLVLVGSSPLPGEEDPDTVNFTKASELKAVLLKRLQAGGKTASPAAAESAYKRLIKDREIRTNLQAIRAVGSEVEYRAVDVRDAAAFSALLQEYSARGRLAGVIHGAGVIEDKLLRDKTPESFDRVFGTKVESTLTLVRNLNPEALKFFALFASITSRYGNRGQSDYAAANEVLSKTACELDRKWPGRVVSIAWGPWAEVGMVAELEKHLTARGLKLIEPALGAKFAVDELVYGSKGEPEVLIAGGTEQAAKPTRVTAPTAELVGVNGTN